MSIVGVTASRKNADVFKEIVAIAPKTQIAIRQSWFALGRDLKNEANKEILRKPKSGITYFIRTKSGRLRRHVASAPGETHANLSGKLRKSVSWKVHGVNRMDFGYGFATIASNKAPEYDTYIEYGTKKIRPRPSIENAVKKIKNNTEDHFHQAMLKQFKRAI